MSRSKISEAEQLLHENMAWGRTLDFYLQENAFLKTRLSQVLDNISGKDFIASAEHFQNSFIHNDESIKDLQRDINHTQHLLKDVITGKKVDEKKLAQKHRKLGNEIRYLEKYFLGLKFEFNKFIETFLKA